MFTPLYSLLSGVIRGVLLLFINDPATLHKSLSINILQKRMYIFHYALTIIL
jgi:hypothetical protein